MTAFELYGDDPALPVWARDAWPAERTMLHGVGTLDWSRPALAIVGTTRPSPIAREWAYQLGNEAAIRGWSVVSGLAEGIDSCAHEGAIAVGGHTLAVIARGINPNRRPPESSLVARILNAGGAIVSVSEPGERGTAERLLLRNKWISAFSIGVVAVQARGRGGTLATMRHAFHQGRVMAAFQPPVDAAQDDWNGNFLLLSETPPWRLARNASYAWQPSRRIEAIEPLFGALEEHHALLRLLVPGERHAQARLFEEPARLEIAQWLN